MFGINDEETNPFDVFGKKDRTTKSSERTNKTRKNVIIGFKQHLLEGMPAIS